MLLLMMLMMLMKIFMLSLEIFLMMLMSIRVVCVCIRRTFTAVLHLSQGSVVGCEVNVVSGRLRLVVVDGCWWLWLHWVHHLMVVL